MKSYREPLDYKQNLIKGAKSKLFEFAKEMRKNSTSAEELLWDRLRRNALGFKFRRQHPFGNFIPDFYCSKKKIAIEVDGSVHSKLGIRQNDICRSEYLKDLGIHVLRFPNSLVENNIDKVIEIISKKLNEL